MYIERFELPDQLRCEWLCEMLGGKNGGKAPYIDNPYPVWVFNKKELSEIYFRPITIFYGSNGSGKTTLLNLIAQKLQLKRVAPFNSSEMFEMYVNECKWDAGEQALTPNSRIISSDEIFDYMLNIRAKNDVIEEEKEAMRAHWSEAAFSETVQFRNMNDYEALRDQNLARRKSRRKYVYEKLGKETNLFSNGETALKFYEQKILEDSLVCLDEPENSLSPQMQMKLVQLLEEMARFCGCQFIIATHSPFVLSLEGARIYNLDAEPITTANWWDLPNVRFYYEFFREHENLFEGRH